MIQVEVSHDKQIWEERSLLSKYSPFNDEASSMDLFLFQWPWTLDRNHTVPYIRCFE